MLEVINLECQRGDCRLFSGLGLTLKQGELLYLQGQNGSGKTTLLRTICGLIQPTEGEVHWDGESIHSLREEFSRDVLYLGHLNGIKDDLTGLENLQISSRLDGVPISSEQAWDALEQMGLKGREDLPVKVLSQGQKRRVALARLLVNRCRLWVLDEPFTALDTAALELLQRVIQGHVESGGMVILTTHQEVSLTSGQVKRLQLGKQGGVA
jgi:heme exporter protein A